MKQISLWYNTFVIYKLRTDCLTKGMPIMHIVRHETRLDFNLWLKYLSATIGCSKCIVHSCNKCYQITVLPIRRPHSFHIFAYHTLSLSVCVLCTIDTLSCFVLPYNHEATSCSKTGKTNKERSEVNNFTSAC